MTTDWHEDGLAAGEACRLAALDYLARGWAAIPCCPPDHVGVGKAHLGQCDHPGKVPLVKWKGYQEAAPTAAETARWWRDYPNANVYLVLGPVSGLVGVDVDGGQGEAFLAESSGGDLPPTLEFATPGGGRRLLYAIPGGHTPRPTHRLGDRIHEGVSLLGQGAGTVMPPSRHAKGGRYAWVPGRGPGEITAAPMPAWLVALMDKGAKKKRTPGGAKKGKPAEGSITDGRRDSTLTSMAGAMRRQAMTPEEIQAGLEKVNERCDPPLPAEQVAKIAASVGRYEPSPDRPKIPVDTDEFRANDAAVTALAAEDDIFQRGGLLVHVVTLDRDPEPADRVRRSPGSVVVRPMAPPLLRDRMTRAAVFTRTVKRGEGEEEVSAHPPGWCVQAVHAMSEWPGVRRLAGVVDHPVMLPDWSILAVNGYDRRTGLLLRMPSDLCVTVPEHPTRDDAVGAVVTLLDAVCDFPFERDYHRSAWLAGLITPVAYYSFDGPAPLTLIDGNCRAVGKGLLADVIALTVLGRPFPVMGYTPDKEELRKAITTLAAEAERLVLLDNLAGPVGNDVLDRALTATHWKDRLLGGNKSYDGPLSLTWYATGNNCELRADTGRRTNHVRLETTEERPETRSNFKYPRLRDHVRANRGRLLSAVLTLLRAWGVAGCPRENLPAWGSYEGWSDVVREALVWAGQPDPGLARDAVQSDADRDAASMRVVLAKLAEIDPAGHGRTAAEVVELAKADATLRAAVEELAGRLDGRTLGNRLRHFKRRFFGNLYLDRAGTNQGAVRWAAFDRSRFSRRQEVTHDTHDTHGADPDPGGECGESGESLPARSKTWTVPVPSTNGTPARKKVRL